MPDSPQPPRRLFRFGLRTMLVVVTVFSVWLGWQAKIVRDRKEAISTIRATGVAVCTRDEWFELCKQAGETPSGTLPEVPIWRRLLGDEAIKEIHLEPDSPKNELGRLKAQFPEASVIQLEWAPVPNAVGQ